MAHTVGVLGRPRNRLFHAINRAAWQPGQRYREATAAAYALDLKLVPYFAWGNRDDTEMSVWLPVR